MTINKTIETNRLDLEVEQVFEIKLQQFVTNFI